MPVVHTTYTRSRKPDEPFDHRIHPELRTTPPRSIIHNYEERVRNIHYIEGTEIRTTRQRTRFFTPPKNSILNAQFRNARMRSLPLSGTQVQNLDPVTGKPRVLLTDRREYAHDYSVAKPLSKREKKRGARKANK